MGKFLMICYVCADFGPMNGEVFKITPSMRGMFVEAPEWIKSTILFKWLVNDGSIKLAEQIGTKQGENDPMKGISAEGKDIEKSSEEPVTVKATKPRTTRKKKDDAQ